MRLAGLTASADPAYVSVCIVTGPVYDPRVVAFGLRCAHSRKSCVRWGMFEMPLTLTK